MNNGGGVSGIPIPNKVNYIRKWDYNIPSGTTWLITSSGMESNLYKNSSGTILGTLNGCFDELSPGVSSSYEYDTLLSDSNGMYYQGPVRKQYLVVVGGNRIDSNSSEDCSICAIKLS